MLRDRIASCFPNFKLTSLSLKCSSQIQFAFLYYKLHSDLRNFDNIPSDCRLSPAFPSGVLLEILATTSNAKRFLSMTLFTLLSAVQSSFSSSSLLLWRMMKEMGKKGAFRARLRLLSFALRAKRRSQRKRKLLSVVFWQYLEYFRGKVHHFQWQGFERCDLYQKEVFLGKKQKPPKNLFCSTNIITQLISPKLQGEKKVWQSCHAK